LFKALSEKGADNREARRPTKLDTLAKVVDAPVADLVSVIDHFRAPENSFLTLSHDAVIDISHESLIRGWRRMRQWVEGEAESASVYRRLADTASLYGQDKAGLLPNRELENVLAWHDREHPNAAWGERYHPGFEQAMAFLGKSRLAHDAECSRRQTARRHMQFVSGTVTAVIAVIAAVALWQWHRAEQALVMATEIANTLVFELGQNPRGGLTPLAMVRTKDGPIASGFEHRSQEVQPSPTSSRSASGITPLPPDLARRLFDRAIQSYTQLIELNATAEAFHGRAAAHYDEGDFNSAISDYDQAIALHRQYAVIFDNRGLAYYAKRDYDHAIADYDQAIALDQKFAAAYTRRGITYHAKGDYDHAMADYDQAIALDPNDTDAYTRRAITYYAKGDYDHAMADYGQVIALDPKDPVGYNNRGVAYHAKGDYDHAIADYDQAIALDPKYTDAYTRRGSAYGGKGDYDHAIADFDRAIALDPKYADAYTVRGLAYHAKGDYDHAIADHDQAIALDPKNAVAYNNRCWVRVAMGRDLQAALSDCNESLRIRPDDAYTLDSRGFVNLKLGQLNDAIADFTAALKYDPKLPTSLYGRGLAEREKGDQKSAVADMAAANAIKPDVAQYLATYGII
jgi:tetratricopeptide (TPR) repeat protein